MSNTCLIGDQLYIFDFNTIMRSNEKYFNGVSSNGNNQYFSPEKYNRELFERYYEEEKNETDKATYYRNIMSRL